jgi:DNA replication protein DnaC
MEHDHLVEMLNRLKLTAVRDQIDSLIDEAARRELTIREALSLFCEREIARKDERRIEMSIGLAGIVTLTFVGQPEVGDDSVAHHAAFRTHVSCCQTLNASVRSARYAEAASRCRRG